MTGREKFADIVVTAFPSGHFEDVIVEGALKPGTIVQTKAGDANANGKFTVQPYTPGATGNRPKGAYAILLADNLQGKTVDDAYVTGTLGRVYYPLPGEELLVLVKSGENISTQANLIIENASGKALLTTGTVESEPFVPREIYAGALAADTLVWCQFAN